MFFDGKKSYAAGGTLIVFGVLGFLSGKIDPEQAIHTVVEGIAVIGLRRAIATK